MAEEHPDYLSYLLRLWRVTGEASGEETAVWRASLESALTGERKGFAGMDDLFDFLQRQTGISPDEKSDE